MARGRYVMAAYLDGLADAQRAISRWQVTRYEKVRALVQRTANNIRRNARRKVPVKSGHLRNSIVIHYASDRTAAFVRAVAPHAHLVEYGTTRGAAPQPFIQPAAEGQKTKYQKELIRIFGETK